MFNTGLSPGNRGVVRYGIAGIIENINQIFFKNILIVVHRGQREERSAEHRTKTLCANQPTLSFIVNNTIRLHQMSRNTTKFCDSLDFGKS